MLPTHFVEAANFPAAWKEKDLQQYIADKLRDQGIRVQLEVRANGGRADIVCDWQGGTIIEVKKYLDRNTIYQAFGQLSLYGLNNTHKLVVMGFLTPDAKEQESALKTASMIEQNKRVQVVFVNLEQEWFPGAVARRSWFKRFQLPRLPRFDDWRWWWGFAHTNPILVVILLSLLVAAFSPIAPKSDQPPPPSPSKTKSQSFLKFDIMSNLLNKT